MHVTSVNVVLIPSVIMTEDYIETDSRYSRIMNRLCKKK